MIKNITATPISRRHFLRTTVIAGAGVATGAVATGAAVATETTPTARAAAKQGYHLTQHIADYYRTAKG
ncbi:MAG: transcriptional initiation protein Tat [Candidatus Competibacteraceae bacterium]|nr:transcriptional initiation protein Tat [Candidatus Competibacteraceae bacterium]